MSTMDLLNLFGEFIEFMQAKHNTVVSAVEVPAEVEPAAAEHAAIPAEVTATSEESPTIQRLTTHEFCKATGLNHQQAYAFARKHEGTLAFRDGVNNHGWHFDPSVVERFTKKNWSRRPVSVMCRELGQQFASIASASKETKIPVHTIRKSMETGKKVGGFHFSRVV